MVKKVNILNGIDCCGENKLPIMLPHRITSGHTTHHYVSSSRLLAYARHFVCPPAVIRNSPSKKERYLND